MNDLEPACWSWPIPPLRDLKREGDRWEQIQADLDVSPDDFLPGTACRLFWGRTPAAAQWIEFHRGAWFTPADKPHETEARCAICGMRAYGGVRLVDDHCHRTGIVRGKLCSGCNVQEGTAYQRTDQVVAYRRRPPAVILGYREFYIGRGWEPGWWEDEGRARVLTANPDWHAGVMLGQ